MNTSISCVVNISTDSITPFSWTTNNPIENRTIENGYVCATVALILLLFGTPLNSFVAVTIIWKKLYKSAVVIPMLNLALCNLAVCILVLPFIVISGYSTEFMFGSSDYVRCKVCAIGVANIALPFASLYTLALMSVGRLLYLKMPLHYHAVVTPAKIFVSLMGIWIFSIAVALPPLWGFGSLNFSYTVSSCIPLVVGKSHILPNFYYIVMLIVVALLPLTVLITMYIWIVCIAHKYILKNPMKFASSHKASKGLTSLSEVAIKNEEIERITNQTNRKKQFRLVQLLGAILLANTITWIPVIALGITGAIAGTDTIPNTFYSFAYLSYLLEIMIHPLLQITLVYELRAIIAKMWVHVKEKTGGYFNFANNKNMESNSS